MPVYRKEGRGPETWRVVLGSRDSRQEWIVHGTKKEAETFEAQRKIERAVAGPARERRAAYDFATFCAERYWPHAKKHLRASTLSVRRYQLDALGRFLGQHKLTDITTEAVETYKEDRADAYEEEHGKPLNPTTINTELTKLQAVLTYAHHLKIPCASPTFIPLPAIGKRRVRVWTEAQIVDLFVACERLAPHLLGPVTFMINTGCRPGEAMAALRSWVHLASGQLRIEPNEFWQPKDNQPREILISDQLRPWLAVDNGTPFLFVNDEGAPWRTFPDATFTRVRAAAGHADECGVWIRPSGGPDRGGEHDEAILEHVATHPGHSAAELAAALELHVDAVKSALRRLQERGRIEVEAQGRRATRTVKPPAGPEPGVCSCGATGLVGGPYALRHSFASNFLRHEPDMFLLAQLMGHSHTRVTALYAHLLPDHLAKSRNVVNLGPRITPAQVAAAKKRRAS